MGRFSDVLLTVDFDRTLTATDSSIPERNLEAIRYFMAEGGAFTVNTGRSLAMELYNYCVSMPDIPDVDMSFSDDDVKAYVEGNVQRTKTITFKADVLQTITFNLPKGVKLVNVSTGKTSAAGASVEICGGTKFYLTAPLSQGVDVNETFSTKMRGSIDKEYSAYKITTGSSSQDLALVFGEGVGSEKYVNLKLTCTN